MTSTDLIRLPGRDLQLIYTTNGIESLSARFRQSTPGRGHFPNEQAWKQILNTLAMTYGDRLRIY